MKTLSLIVVLAALAVCTQSANLSQGHPSAFCRLLYRNYYRRNAIPNAVQYQDVTYRSTNSTVRISSIRATEVGGTQFASPSIRAGGVNRNNVTIRLTSARGRGYYYMVEIWGR
ncbi:uncharacterized protein LOC110381622 [Helicoverpa armigera]|uniref:uncharacterized protein LOC110381622 n=1 Tax=Helicoverpa armigera TaxID=29058 RepID=UPI003083726D